MKNVSNQNHSFDSRTVITPITTYDTRDNTFEVPRMFPQLYVLFLADWILPHVYITL